MTEEFQNVRKTVEELGNTINDQVKESMADLHNAVERSIEAINEKHELTKEQRAELTLQLKMALVCPYLAAGISSALCFGVELFAVLQTVGYFWEDMRRAAITKIAEESLNKMTKNG